MRFTVSEGDEPIAVRVLREQPPMQMRNLFMIGVPVVVDQLVKKLTVSPVHQQVIAIGKHGGKIVGYGAGHKPIYLQDPPPTPVQVDKEPEDPTHAKLLQFCSGLWSSPATTELVAFDVAPHPKLKDVFAIKVKSKANTKAAKIALDKRVAALRDTGTFTATGTTPSQIGVRVNRKAIRKDKSGAWHLMVKLDSAASKPKEPAPKQLKTKPAPAAAPAPSTAPIPVQVQPHKETKKPVADKTKETFTTVQSLPGGHSVKKLKGDHGTYLVWKKATDQSGKFDPKLGHAEVGASQIANKLTGGLTPVAEWMDYQGESGIAQPFIDGYAQMPPPSELDDKQTAQLVAHMVADWITSNHDSHMKQFGLDKAGNVIGIDKGQAFKHFQQGNFKGYFASKGQGEPGQLTPSWFPHTNYGTPAYKLLEQAVKSGKATFDPSDPAIKDAIAAAKSLTVSNVEAAMKGYADIVSKGKQQAFYQAVVERAHGIEAELQQVFKSWGMKTSSSGETVAGFAVVDHTELTTTVDLKKAPGIDHLLNATATVYVGGGMHEVKVIGRRRVEVQSGNPNAHGTFVVRRKSDSKLFLVTKASLLTAEKNGNVTPAQGHPIYSSLPATAVVVDAGIEIKNAMTVAMKSKMKGGATIGKAIGHFASHGVKSLIVGGTVRDALQNTAINDIDICVTTSHNAAAQIMNGLAGAQMQKIRNAQSLVVMKGAPGVDGLDIASIRAYGYNSKVWGGEKAGFASDGIDMTEDAIARDFACNAVYYDPEHNTIIDATGRGLSDGSGAPPTLHPASADTKAWLESNGPRNFARAFKFISRGYKVSPELVATMQQNWLAQKKRPGALKQMGNAMYKESKKGYAAGNWHSKKAKMKAWVNANITSKAVAKSMIASINGW